MKNLYGLVLENTIQFHLLENEILKYWSLRKKDIPSDIRKSATVYKKNTVTYHRMAITRAYLLKPTPLFCKIALLVLTTP